MHRAERSINLRAINVWAVTALLTFIGCMSSNRDRDNVLTNAPPLESIGNVAEQEFIDPESTPHSEVSVVWRAWKDLSRATLDSSAALIVDVQNATPKDVQGRLFLVTAGLDSRRIKRPLQDFKLSPNGGMEVTIPIRDLPIQSENSTSRV